MPDFDNLPLVLAGPIVRRVEPTLASVWVALSAPRTVELGIWVGETSVSATGTFLGSAGASRSGSASTIRVGEKLHLALVTLDLTGSPLIPAETYAYNLSFIGVGNEDLSTEGLLDDDGPALEPTRLALGYVPGLLPTFTLPPSSLEELRIAHGSCRKAHGHGADALAALDDLIERTRGDSTLRPQQLFLTGDQVYADDVAMALLPQLTAAGNALLGTEELLPLRTETGEQTVAATAAEFPTTWRQELIRQQAGMSSDEASSHALSFGEYCALHLFFWSNVLWDDLASCEEVFPECDLAGPNCDDADHECIDADALVATLPPHLQNLYPPPRAERKKRIDERNELRDDYKEQSDNLNTFRKALPRVQRALANVPTYMIFDDHEVTDDWYLTQDWRDRVLSSPLGVTMLRNGLLAFSLFQGWGDDPQRHESGPHADLLAQAQLLFPATGGPVSAVADQIDGLFGFDGTDPDIDFGFTVPSGPTVTVALDTRTRRTYDSGRYGPPGLLSADALDQQLPASLAPSPGAELVIIVSPAPVLGLATIEEIAKPISARGATDFIKATLWRHEPKITGYLQWDAEDWSLDTARFEALLSRLHELKKVVILSGDPHYAYSAEMDYWKRGEPEPTRVVQLTASALKNEWDGVPKRALETVTAQRLLQGTGYPATRLGWEDPVDLVGNVHVPADAISRNTRASLRRTPVVLRAEGWPAGSHIDAEPDWAWRMSLVQDVRPDSSTAPNRRPEDGRLSPITPDLDAANPDEGYLAVLLRAEKQLKNKIARSVVFASQLGLVSFSGTGTTRGVRHELMYEHPAGAKDDDPKAYTVHEMSLIPTSDPQPSIG